MLARAWRWTVVVGIVTACGPSVAPPAGSTATTRESTESSGAPQDTSSRPEPTPGEDTTSTTGTSTSTSTTSDDPPPPLDECDGGFIELYDTAILECDLAAQDCGLGNKCTLYIDPFVGEWMGSMCVSVVPDPAALGEPCTVDDHYGSGFDTCDRGGMCFYVDPATLEGTCVGYCGGRNPPWMAECDQPATTCRRDPVFGGPELLCLAECDPLVQGCPANQGCYALTVDGWFCEPTFGGAMAEPGDPCSVDLDCVPGSICSGAGSLASCESGGCCTPICEVGMNEQCPNFPLELCRPLSARLPHLGFCGE